MAAMDFKRPLACLDGGKSPCPPADSAILSPPEDVSSDDSTKIDMQENDSFVTARLPKRRGTGRVSFRDIDESPLAESLPVDVNHDKRFSLPECSSTSCAFDDQRTSPQADHEIIKLSFSQGLASVDSVLVYDPAPWSSDSDNETVIKRQRPKSRSVGARAGRICDILCGCSPLRLPRRWQSHAAGRFIAGWRRASLAQRIFTGAPT
mmetsp:Transcript_58824/g.164256  ORF Transcript_58824/g.164256 Transcript_58824/m.164256 type:complete len:207 (-) Transcript_58824:128-748(-)